MTQADLLNTMIEATDAHVYLKDEQGQILMVNRRIEEMFKLTKDTIIGKTDYELLPQGEADTVRDNDRRVREAGTPMSFKTTITLPDGPHTFIDHKFPVSNVPGATKAVGGIAIDITDLN